MGIGVMASLPPPRPNKSSNPAHFALVHGAGHGAWCWYKVRNLLEQYGHRVTCVDLLASGRDSTSSTDVTSFDDYNRPLDALLLHGQVPNLQQPDPKFILVGHSAGCLSVTRAIHNPISASRLAAAVYVAGTMLPSGRLKNYKINERLRQAFSHGTDGVLAEEDQRQLYYNKSPPEDAVLASMLLRRAPAVFHEAWWEGGGPWVDEVKRVFVKTSDGDMICDSTKQQQTVEDWPPSMVLEVDSDHSPFFSTPRELCDGLLKVAAECGLHG